MTTPGVIPTTSSTTTSPIMSNNNKHLNVISTSLAQPVHYSALIGKTISFDKLHNVTVEEVIAEGGFGVIFLVKNSNDKLKYALKRVVVNNERDYSSVVSEVSIMSSIPPTTPNILKSLTHTIVSYPPPNFTREIQTLMPLCKQNLFQLASQRMTKSLTFTDAEILLIVTQVCRGLKYLHTSTPQIIHRDIKIENILSLEDTYVVSDFGSSTTRVWDPNTDSVNSIQEDLDKHTTLQYRSPEMVDLYGNRGPITIPSDVWALGVSAFKLMTFKDPFENILAIQNRNLSWGSVKGKYSEQLVSLVECLLAEHQVVRPNVDEVIKIVAGIVASDFNPVTAAVDKINEFKVKVVETTAEVHSKSRSGSTTVVLETSVTPRQRPKRGNVATNGVPVATAVLPPVIPAPPKSPKPTSASPAAAGSSDSSASRFFSPPSTTATTPQQQHPSPSNKQAPTPSPTSQQPAPQSWNPFDEDYNKPTTELCDNDSIQDDDEDDDPFAKAPFDYFKYQPIMVTTATTHDCYNNAELLATDFQPAEMYYAPNNPFLVDYQEDTDNNLIDNSVHSYESSSHISHNISNNNAAELLSSGVTNLSFDEEFKK